LIVWIWHIEVEAILWGGTPWERGFFSLALGVLVCFFYAYHLDRLLFGRGLPTARQLCSYVVYHPSGRHNAALRTPLQNRSHRIRTDPPHHSYFFISCLSKCSIDLWDFVTTYCSVFFFYTPFYVVFSCSLLMTNCLRACLNN